MKKIATAAAIAAMLGASATANAWWGGTGDRSWMDDFFGARVRDVIPLWLADLDASSLAPSTRQLYAAAARLYVQPALGDLRLGELSPALIDRALGQVRLSHGPQPARAARRALSSLCRDALRNGATSTSTT